MVCLCLQYSVMGAPRPVCLGSKCSAIGAPYRCVLAHMQCHGSPRRCVYAHNIVPWEPQTGMFWLQMQCHGISISARLYSQCSAIGAPDRYVLATNVVPWDPHIGVFWLICSAMEGTNRCVQAQNEVPWETHIGVFILKMQCHGRPRLVYLGLKCSTMGALYCRVNAHNVVPWEPQTGMFRLKCCTMGFPYRCVLAHVQCHGRHRLVRLASQFIAMGISFWCVLAQYVVPWEPHIGMFILKMQCHGSPISVCFGSNVVPWEPISVCLCSQCSAMGAPDLYVQVKCSAMRGPDPCVSQNMQCRESQTGVFRLKMWSIGGPGQHVWALHKVPLYAQASTPGLEMQCYGRPIQLCPRLQYSAIGSLRLALLGFSIQRLWGLLVACLGLAGNAMRGPDWPFQDFPYSAPSRVQGPHRQCHWRHIPEIPCCATGRPDRPCRESIYSANVWFPLNNFSLLWPIDSKLAVWVAYIKRQLRIATRVSVIKVEVIVTKNRNSVSTQ